MKGGLFDTDQEVYGVAGRTVIGADPVVVFDDDLRGKTADGIVAVWARLEAVAEVFEDRLQRRVARTSDVRLRPGTTARQVRAVPDHGLFSSGVASGRG